MKLNPGAGQLAISSDRVDVPKLITAYYARPPGSSHPEQRAIFGTSGHRGSSFYRSFNEWRILAIAQAICQCRRQPKIEGPLFLETTLTHFPGLLWKARRTSWRKMTSIMLADKGDYTPLAVIAHAILGYNRVRKPVCRMAL